MGSNLVELDRAMENEVAHIQIYYESPNRLRRRGTQADVKARAVHKMPSYRAMPTQTIGEETFLGSTYGAL